MRVIIAVFLITILSTQIESQILNRSVRMSRIIGDTLSGSVEYILDNPVFVDTINIGGVVREGTFWVEDGYMFIGKWGDNFQIWDITKKPAEKIYDNIAFGCNAFEYHNGFGYHMSLGNLKITDMRDKTNPVLVYTDPNNLTFNTVRGEWLYGTNTCGGYFLRRSLRTFEIDTIGTEKVTGCIYQNADIDFYEDYAYVTTGSISKDTIHIFDLRGDSLATRFVPGGTVGTMSMEIVDNYMLVAYRDTLRIYRLDNPKSPTFLSKIYIPSNAASFESIQIVPGYAWLTDNNIAGSIFTCVDWTDPLNPRIKYQQKVKGVSPRSTFLYRGNLFIADRNSNYIEIWKVAQHISVPGFYSRRGDVDFLNVEEVFGRSSFFRDGYYSELAVDSIRGLVDIIGNTPLDSRDTLTTLADTIRVQYKYPGLLAYVDALDKFYVYDGFWKELVTSGGGSIAGVDSTSLGPGKDSVFVHSGANKYFSGRTDGLPVFNVKNFGATGDGTTNDFAAIKAAVDAVNSSGGGRLYFPKGTYRIEYGTPGVDPLLTNISGNNWAVIPISTDGFQIVLSGDAQLDVRAGFNDINTAGATVDTGVSFLATTSFFTVTDFVLSGGRITFDTLPGTRWVNCYDCASGTSFLSISTDRAYFLNVEVDGFPQGGAFTGVTDANGNQWNNGYFENVRVTNYGAGGHDNWWYVQGGNTFINCLFKSTRQYQSHCLYWGADRPNNKVIGCTFDGVNTSNKWPLHIYGQSGGDIRNIVIVGNYFANSLSGILMWKSNVADSVRNVVVANNVFDSICSPFDLKRCVDIKLVGNVIAKCGPTQISCSGCRNFNVIDEGITGGSTNQTVRHDGTSFVPNNKFLAGDGWIAIQSRSPINYYGNYTIDYRNASGVSKLQDLVDADGFRFIRSVYGSTLDNENTFRLTNVYSHQFNTSNTSAVLFELYMNNVTGNTSNNRFDMFSISLGTKTGTAEVRGINISPNYSDFYGIYQSGALSKNYFNGNTGFGISNPTEKVDITGNLKYSGVLKSPSGLVGTPSLTFQGDENTGIYSPSAEEVAITTNGVERFKVTPGVTYITGRLDLEDATSVFVGKNTGVNDDGTNNYNTGVGFNVLNSNTSGEFNSVGGGAQVLFSNTTGSNNSVGAGYQAMFWNTIGSDNSVGAGYQALFNNTSGNFNSVGAGRGVLFSNTTGSNNSVGAGYQAGLNNTTGQFNSIGAGYRAFYQNTVGSYNSIGAGAEALYNNVSGSYNTVSGYQAGKITSSNAPNDSSSYCVLIGYDTRTLSNVDSNEVVIGSQAVGSGSNTVTIGNTSITGTFLRGQITSNLIGSAASPTFSFENDNDTGIFSPSANQVGFSAGGVQQAYVRNTGLYLESDKRFGTISGDLIFQVGGSDRGRWYGADGSLALGSASATNVDAVLDITQTANAEPGLRIKVLDNADSAVVIRQGGDNFLKVNTTADEVSLGSTNVNVVLNDWEDQELSAASTITLTKSKTYLVADLTTGFTTTLPDPSASLAGYRVYCIRYNGSANSWTIDSSRASGNDFIADGVIGTSTVIADNETAQFVCLDIAGTYYWVRVTE